jgi:retinol dehydrogenase-14
MDHKIVLVTGSTDGIGYQTALELARRHATVVVNGKDEARCQAAVQSIRRLTENESPSYLLADLSSQAQVRAMVEKFLDQHDRLDVLVNNAGISLLRRRLSVDGLEMTFAVNHLAHFLLTNLLLEALKRSPSARVIMVSSGAHYGQHLDFDDLQLAHFYTPIKAYGRSKLANILFAYELARRLEGTHVTSNALTPGMVATEIWRKVNRLLGPLIYTMIKRRAQTPAQGAQTSIYLAISHEVEGVSGKYYAYQHPVRSSDASYDLSTARRLWDVSAQLVAL